MKIVQLSVSILFFYPSLVLSWKRVKDAAANITWFVLSILFWLISILFLTFWIFLELSSYLVLLDKIIISLSFGLFLVFIFLPSKKTLNNTLGNETEQKKQIESDNIKYFPVKVLKFICMSFFTFWIYSVYWFYKNWKYIKNNFSESKKIFPLLRALLSPVFYYSLLKNIQISNDSYVTMVIALSYLSILLIWRVYDIVELFAFLALLPAVYKINQINNASTNEDLKNNKHYNFNAFNYVVIALWSIVLFYAILVSFYILPGTQNIKWDKLWSWQKDYLIDSQIVEKDEEIQYFYSQWFNSIKTDGNIVTDKGITSYSKLSDGSAVKNTVAYSDITSFEEEKDIFMNTIIIYFENNEDYGSSYIFLDTEKYYEEIKNYIDSSIIKGEISE